MPPGLAGAPRRILIETEAVGDANDGFGRMEHAPETYVSCWREPVVHRG